MTWCPGCSQEVPHELVYRYELDEANARIEQLEAALREIKNCHLSRFEVHDLVCAVLDQSSPSKVLLPCPVCGGEAIHAVDVLKRTIIQPARQENDDVYPGFRGNNEA